MALLGCLLFFVVSVPFHYASSRSFTIDYERNVFLKDGQPFRYVSGSIHYFRVPRQYWRDRLMKMKAAGLDAIQTYVAWHVHERVQGQYDFQGDNDVVNFIELAASLGLLVIVRPGPFIAAERDMGGFPPWLLKNYTAEYMPPLRTSLNTAYMDAVDRWMGVMLPKLRPLIYANGGPIVAVQVENEYGNAKQCDLKYLAHLQALFEENLGKNVVLFTNNGCAAPKLECGTLPELLSTLDFKGGERVIQSCFAHQKFFQPAGPLVNSEFYPGWIANWGLPFPHVSAKVVKDRLDILLSLNVSVNIYMFHGGTNFGFMNGASLNGNEYKPQLTSYDYGAPLSEAGDPTKKYFVVREVIKEHKGLPPLPVPPSTPKHAYGIIPMEKMVSLLDVLPELVSPGGPIHARFPRPMESVGQNYGFMLYRTLVPPTFCNKTVHLNIQGLRDRGILFVGKERKATLSRSDSANVTVALGSDPMLDVLVENQGHITRACIDLKGIVGNVSINGAVLSDWQMFPLNLENIAGCGEDCVHGSSDPGKPFSPTFYRGRIPPSPGGIPNDTFLRFDNWHKGQVFVNGFNLGRYWPAVGPQETLFLPATLLKSGQEESTLVLLELDGAPCGTPEDCVVESVSIPVLNGPIHPYNIVT